MLTISDKQMNKLINNLGELIRWPKKPPEKEIIIKYLSTKFESDKKYTEKEIHGIIDKYHLFNDTPPLKKRISFKRVFRKGR